MMASYSSAKNAIIIIIINIETLWTNSLSEYFVLPLLRLFPFGCVAQNIVYFITNA